MFFITKYTNEKGITPYDEFIKELEKNGCLKEMNKIKHYIELLEIYGDKLLFNKDHAKIIAYDLCELRPFPNRIFYYHCKYNDKYVLLHCFKKKTNKTPKDEIEKALVEINEYERMIKNEK